MIHALFSKEDYRRPRRFDSRMFDRAFAGLEDDQESGDGCAYGEDQVSFSAAALDLLDTAD